MTNTPAEHDTPDNTRIEMALDKLLIKSHSEILSRIEKVSFDVEIRDTKAKGYCYCLKIDANGNLRLQDLIDYIDLKLVEFAMPKEELDKAFAYQEETGSPSQHYALRKKALRLFTDLEKTGEGGELLLYILTQEFLKLPQLISKMSLKTSGKVHYQGTDGIHVKYDTESQMLCLYWGEAKMYKTINDAIADCFKSLNGYLLDPFGYKSIQERDIQLLTANLHANINDADLEKFLVRYLDKDDDLSNSLLYKGICFIGFDSDKYPTDTNGITTNHIKAEIEKELEKWYSTVSSRICSHEKLNLKEIHVFLMPFPSVEDFRKRYLEVFH